MKPGNLGGTDCLPISEILSRIGDKWSVMIVMTLHRQDGRVRFSELRRTVDGISQKMLTATLRGLERDGFVTRTIYPTIPPKVEYELTELGRELAKPVMALGEFALCSRELVLAARERFDTAAQEASWPHETADRRAGA